MFQHETGCCYITQAYNVRQTFVLMYSNSEEMHDGRPDSVCVCECVCEDDDEQLEASDTERK